jgi:hypothetical protein
VPDNPTQPGQLPRQQFAASNDATRSQSRMARLEERVKQLEQGKQLIQTPMFTWRAPAIVSSTTDYTWTISVPYPPAQLESGSVLLESLFYWFRIPIQAVGGAVSGDLNFTSGGSTLTWTWTIATAGTAAIYAPNPAGTAAVNLPGRTSLMVSSVAPASIAGPLTDVQIQVVRTSASNSFNLGVSATNNWPRFYGIVPPSLTS